MHIDAEPLPRNEPLAWNGTEFAHDGVYQLSREILTPKIGFLDVLSRRASLTGGTLSERQLSSVLWHSMLLRESGRQGRFAIGWESRNAPSAGGLHPLRLLVIPIEDSNVVGIHEPDQHVLLRCAVDQTIRATNRASVSELTGAKAGTTLQIVADPSKTSSCYEWSESLLLRDVGALVAIISLVATALGLTSCALGRAGTQICRIAGLPEPFVGLGAVHLGSSAADAS